MRAVAARLLVTAALLGLGGAQCTPETTGECGGKSTVCWFGSCVTCGTNGAPVCDVGPKCQGCCFTRDEKFCSQYGDDNNLTDPPKPPGNPSKTKKQAPPAPTVPPATSQDVVCGFEGEPCCSDNSETYCLGRNLSCVSSRCQPEDPEDEEVDPMDEYMAVAPSPAPGPAADTPGNDTETFHEEADAPEEVAVDPPAAAPAPPKPRGPLKVPPVKPEVRGPLGKLQKGLGGGGAPTNDSKALPDPPKETPAPVVIPNLRGAPKVLGGATVQLKVPKVRPQGGGGGSTPAPPAAPKAVLDKGSGGGGGKPGFGAIVGLLGEKADAGGAR